MHRTIVIVALLTSGTVSLSSAAAAQQGSAQSEVAALRAELARTRMQLDVQERRLQTLEAQIRQTAAVTLTDPSAAAGVPRKGAPGPRLASEIERVGEQPQDFDRPPAVAVLGDMGNVLTRKGQITTEVQVDYTRLDRNRTLFRGLAIAQAALIGIFDINESRQDVSSASLAARYGVSTRLELGVRLPYVYRRDASVLAPVQGSTADPNAAMIPEVASGHNIGDVELQGRYQLTSARGGMPFLIGNLQIVAPTGTSPYRIPRAATGAALEAATGGGFWSVSPSLTAIVPSDPAVLFGTIGYSHNVGRTVNADIGSVRVARVQPGDQISTTTGVGLSVNDRLSLNLGYAHTFGFGARSTVQIRNQVTNSFGEPQDLHTRNLQVGRLLFGLSYRVSDAATANFSVEVGATQDAPDVRTVFRLPLTIAAGR
jgi:hypothetical protein